MIKIGDSYFSKVSSLSLRNDSDFSVYCSGFIKYTVCVNRMGVKSFDTLEEAEKFLEKTAKQVKE